MDGVRLLITTVERKVKHEFKITLDSVELDCLTSELDDAIGHMTLGPSIVADLYNCLMAEFESTYEDTFKCHAE